MTEPKTTIREKRGAVKYILFGVLAAACIAVFLFFGQKQILAPKSADGQQTAAPLPSGVPYGKFIEALRGCDLGFTLGEAELIDENTLRYELTSDEPKDSGALTITTDAYGRVAEAELTVNYLQPEYPDYSVAPDVVEALEAERLRRTAADEKLINAYLDAVCAVFGIDYGFGSIDRSKLSPNIIDSYETGKLYDKKSGKTRFFCETTADGNRKQFDLTILFTQPK